MAKAWIAQAEAGEAGAADEARLALARLERHYLCHPVAGGWYDQFDRDGASLVATIPASSFYHVLSAVAEAEQVLGLSTWAHHSHRFRRLKLFRFLKLLRWSPAPPR
jgi:mannose-6-phosphate isomerase